MVQTGVNQVANIDSILSAKIYFGLNFLAKTDSTNIIKTKII